MIHRLFLLTSDPCLEARVRAASRPLAAECEITSGPAPSASGDYELLLVDDRLSALLPGAAARHQPRIILLASAPTPHPEAFQPGLVDVIRSTASKAQILLVLRQQLGILQLLRLRGRLAQDSGASPQASTGRSLPADINNPLTGIFGNADLALASRGRIPPDVRHRLECVRDLAAQIRDRLAASRRAA